MFERTKDVGRFFYFCDLEPFAEMLTGNMFDDARYDRTCGAGLADFRWNFFEMNLLIIFPFVMPIFAFDIGNRGGDEAVGWTNSCWVYIRTYYASDCHLNTCTRPAVSSACCTSMLWRHFRSKCCCPISFDFAV